MRPTFTIAAGLLVVNAAVIAVLIALQAGGIAASMWTLFPVVLSMLLTIAATGVSAMLMLYYTHESQYPIFAPFALTIGVFALQVCSGAGLYIWIGENGYGTFSNASGLPMTILRYYRYSFDVTSGAGYGYTVADGDAVESLFFAHYLASFISIWMVFAPSLVAALLHREKMQRPRY